MCFIAVFADMLNQSALGIYKFDDILSNTVFQLIRRAKRNQFTAGQDANPVAKGFRFFDIVRSNDNRSSINACFADNIPHLASDLRIQSNRRLIQKQYGWFGEKSPGYKKPALHSA